MNQELINIADKQLDKLSIMSEGAKQRNFTSVIVKNPEVALLVIKLIVKIAEWAINAWIDKKTGRMKTPFWVKLAAWLGSTNAKELQGIADDAIGVTSKLGIK